MRKIGIIGCGNMGEAILSGIVSNEVTSHKDIFVSDVDSTRLNHIKRLYNVNVTFNNVMIADESDIIIMAVKPQDMDSALGGISECLNQKKLLISIAAGVKISRISALVGNDVPVARVMPNIPAIIKMGFSAVSFSKNVNKNSAKSARAIFSSIGDVIELKEKDLDAITAISGSGPAYFFYLVEVLIKSGLKLGLTAKTARKAAIKTALGSAELLNRLQEDPHLLRKRVTSKGGTTEAAFKVFDKRGLGTIIQNGIKAARDRSKKLSRG